MRAKFINESVVGTILTTIAIFYLLKFIESLLETPEQKLEKRQKKIFSHIYFVTRSRLDEPEKAPIYSDEYWFHKITFPEKNRIFKDYEIKIHKETKFMTIYIGGREYSPCELNDEQYDKFLKVIEKIKEGY